MVNSVTISVVIPMRNERDLLKPLFQRLLPVLEGLNEGFEVICVNDGSTDDTLERLKKRNAKHAAIRIVDLSRGFGKEAALTAGIDLARGRAVVVMDADLQDPPELIADFVAKWREGWQVVYGARRSRDKDSWLKRTTAKAFYAVFNRLSRTPIPPDAGDFRLMDRRVVDALKRLGEHARFMKGLFAWVGFKYTSVPFDRPERKAGESQWPFLRLLRFAFDGIFSFSTIPLRLLIWLGAVTAAVALLRAAYLVVRTWVFGIDVPGYASLMVAVLFFGGVQLISTGVLGEYIGRIFTESKNRPLYIVNQIIGFDEEPSSKN